MKRLYEMAAKRHLKKYRQMLFLAGPRQVGKTTLGRNLGEEHKPFWYFTWDNPRHQELVATGPDALALAARLGGEGEALPLLMLDEVHRFPQWKRFLKGLFDTYPNEAHLLVTGSARLDVYQRGADSLMGRYFLYRVHPLSVAELLDPESLPQGLRPEPRRLDEEAFAALWRFGGFPEPYFKADDEFYSVWKRQRAKLLFSEDLRDLSQVQQVSQVELLAELLRRQVGQLSSYTSLARKVRASPNSVRSWLEILGYLYYSFEVRPWSRNIARALTKEPKFYLWDWSLVPDEAARAENFVASHLLKAVHYWTDMGQGEFALHFLRDREKREVDFVVTRNDEPWMLIEVKLRNSTKVSSSLRYYQKQLQADYALQVVMEMPYEGMTCFVSPKPKVVPARTFLSQLI